MAILKLIGRFTGEDKYGRFICHLNLQSAQYLRGKINSDIENLNSGDDDVKNSEYINIPLRGNSAVMYPPKIYHGANFDFNAAREYSIICSLSFYETKYNKRGFKLTIQNIN